MLAAEKNIPLVLIMTAPDEVDYLLCVNEKHKEYLIKNTNVLRQMVELPPINDWLEWYQSSDLLIAM